MPDRELPEHIKAQLDRELTAGTPLSSPLPAQARYAQLASAPMSSRQRWRLLSAVGAAAALIAVTALAGPPQARDWIGHSVGTLAHDVQRSTGDDTPSPSPEKSPAQQPSAVPPSPHESPEPSESPEASQSPEPTESPEPSESPEVHESPQPSPSSSPEGDHGGSSPSPEPSDGGSHN